MSGSDADIIIRVGAAADSSVQTVFDSLPKSALRASQAAKRSFAGSTTAAAREEARVTKAAESEAAKRTRAAMKEFDDKLKGATKLRKQMERDRQKENDAILRDVKRISAAEERELVKRAKVQQRESEARAKREERDARRRGEKGAQYVTGAIGSVGHKLAAIGTTIAGGAGINLDLGSHISNTVDLNRTATKIANQAAFVSGKPATAADVADVTGTIKGAGDASGVGYNDVAAGLDTFMAKTGDLGLAKSTLADMSKLAAAADVSMGDLSGTAGEVATALGNVPNKGEKMLEILRAITLQGAQGSVEIADLAQYGARLSSMSEFIAGDKSTSIAQMSWMAQQAKATGTATDAAEATGATKSFMSDLMKVKNATRMEASGVNIWADKGHHQLKAPSEIMAQLFEKTGGDMEKISALVPNAAGRKAVLGFAQTFNEAGGGKAGADAIRKSFEEHSKALSKEQVDKANELYQNSDAGRAQRTNNKLDDLGAQLFEKLGPVLEKSLPGLEKLGEEAIKVAGEIGEFAGAHPVTAITAAIAGQIAASGMGNAIGNAFSKLLGSNFGGILAGAAVTFSIGKATIDILADASDKSDTDQVNLENARANAEHLNRVAPGSPEARQATQEVRDRERQIEDDRRRMKDSDSFIADVTGFNPYLALEKFVGGDEGVSFSDQKNVNRTAPKVVEGVDSASSMIDRIIATATGGNKTDSSAQAHKEAAQAHKEAAAASKEAAAAQKEAAAAQLAAAKATAGKAPMPGRTPDGH